MKIILSKCEKSKKCGNLRKIQNFGYCAPIKTEDDIAELVEHGWGNLTFTFDDNVKFIWMPKNYHYLYKAKENEYYLCLGFDEEKRSTILLGTTFMHGFDIIFDREKHRIGMVEANCSKASDKNNEDNNINTNNETDINNGLNIDNFDADEITNILSNKSKNNISERNSDKKEFTTNGKINYDSLIIKISYCVIFIIFVLFVLFNVILCRNNYNAIQQRKDDEDIDKFVMENYRYDINNGPISLFNDNI